MVAGLPEIQRNLDERSDHIEIELSQLRFDLDALDAVIVVDVLNLMGQHAGEFVLVGHQIKHAFADIHGSAGKREGVQHVVVVQNGERVRQMPTSVKRDVGPDAADVFLEPLLLGGERTRRAGVAGSELAPDRDFLLVGQPREMHGQARKITLRVGSHVQDRVR